jgi:small GTP-binding protein
MNVGKTSIIEKFNLGTFTLKNNPTIGVDYETKDVRLPGQLVRLQLWDTAGQERYRSLIPSYVRNADSVVIVFDVTKPASFKSVQHWH